MLSLKSASLVIAASIYYADELCDSDETFEQFINRKLPELENSERQSFRYVSKDRLIVDYAFRTKNNVEYQLLIQRDYILFSRYATVRTFRDERKAYCNLNGFFTRSIFSSLNEYTEFVKGNCGTLDMGISGKSLVQWMIKYLSKDSLSNLEKQVICYEIKQLVEFCGLDLLDDTLFNVFGISHLKINNSSLYNEALQEIYDIGFLIWKSYFKSKSHYFYQLKGVPE
jgi:hypothetical protein